MFSDHNGIKQEINNRRVSGKPQNTCRLNKIRVNNRQVKKSQEKLKNILN